MQSNTHTYTHTALVLVVGPAIRGQCTMNDEWYGRGQLTAWCKRLLLRLFLVFSFFAFYSDLICGSLSFVGAISMVSIIYTYNMANVKKRQAGLEFADLSIILYYAWRLSGGAMPLSTAHVWHYRLHSIPTVDCCCCFGNGERRSNGQSVEHPHQQRRMLAGAIMSSSSSSSSILLAFWGCGQNGPFTCFFFWRKETIAGRGSASQATSSSHSKIDWRSGDRLALLFDEMATMGHCDSLRG